MNKKFKLLLSLILLTVCSACSGTESNAEIYNQKIESQKKSFQYYTPLSPNYDYSDIVKDVIFNLGIYHYKTLIDDVTYDDNLSEKYLRKYLKELDPSKIFFSKKDIDNIYHYRHKFDDYLISGNLDVLYQIYNLYQKKVAERYIKIINSDFSKVSFEKDEEILIDSERADWAIDEAALDEIWRKRIKNALLSEKLSAETGKKKSSFIDEIKKKYKNRLKRLGQSTTEDAFKVIMGVLTDLYDPHTEYFSAKDWDDFNTRMKLSFEGIGAHLLREDGYTKVVRLVVAGPADKAGDLKAGDRIVGVGQGNDGDIVDIVGWRLDKVVELIKGPKGTVVQLKIIPKDAKSEHNTKVIRITRDTVKLEEQAASSKIIKKKSGGKNYKIGVIHLPAFYRDFGGRRFGISDYRSSSRDVERELQNLKAQGVQGIIVDLRDNAGGSLAESTEISGLFIDEGPVVQVRKMREKHVLSDLEPGVVYDGPIIIMVNRLSASASEIFAGAMQDYNRGIVVGSQTFGKGTVQTVPRLGDGAMKVTESKFFRISGGSTQHKGVIPDVEMPEFLDKTEIGESALEGALPWDTITPANYHKFKPLKGYIEKLEKLHKKRVAKSPDFQYLIKTIEKLKENKNENTLSLNEKKRRAKQGELDQWRLSVENQRRLAKGEKPFKTIKEMDSYKENKSNEKRAKPQPINIEDDTILNETAEMMVDYIKLLKQK